MVPRVAVLVTQLWTGESEKLTSQAVKSGVIVLRRVFSGEIQSYFRYDCLYQIPCNIMRCVICQRESMDACAARALKIVIVRFKRD